MNKLNCVSDLVSDMKERDLKENNDVPRSLYIRLPLILTLVKQD